MSAGSSFTNSGCLKLADEDPGVSDCSGGAKTVPYPDAVSEYKVEGDLYRKSTVTPAYPLDGDGETRLLSKVAKLDD